MEKACSEPKVWLELEAILRQAIHRHPIFHILFFTQITLSAALFFSYLSAAIYTHLFNPWDTPTTAFEFTTRRHTLTHDDDTILIDGTTSNAVKWEGFGTSLCWWGMGVGKSHHEGLFSNLIFSMDSVQLPDGRIVPGLGLQILRYNLGGFGRKGDKVLGEEPVESVAFVPWHHRLEGFVVRDEKDPLGKWDWSRDDNQRSMLAAATKLGVLKVELFANAPMWFMTHEKNSAGGRLDDKFGNAFAEYVADVTQHAIQEWRVPVYSVELFNEPSAGWWRFGQTTQEGCNVNRGEQETLLRAFRVEMARKNLSQILISSSDENGLNTGIVSYIRLRNEMDQVNVHSYYGLQPWRKNRTRRILRRVVLKKLWMSEYGDGEASGRVLAQTIFEDINFMHPSAWVYWQVVEANNDWGMLNAMFYDEDLKDSPKRGTFTKINRKFFIYAHFTRFIRAGALIIPTTNRDTVAAYDETQKSLAIVFMTNSQERSLFFDLQGFHVLNDVVNITVTPFDEMDVRVFRETIGMVVSGKVVVTAEPHSIYSLNIKCERMM
ncbi:glycoside hydrolase superfamily [Chytridium lagenaria]|nr:glycoside hydrolase superfamily [Chytridium lagenaria]